MEQRQHHELHGLGRDQGGDAEVDAVPEYHAVGDDRALGVARGAGRVHHHGDVVVREGGGRRRGQGRGEGTLIGAVGPVVVDLEPVRRERGGLLGEGLVVDQEFRRRVAQDVFQLGHREPPVERQHDGAQPAAGELDLEVLGAVGRQQGDAVAAADAHRRQHRGQPGNAPVEIRVTEFTRRLQIVEGERRRTAAGVVGDPVVIGDGGCHGGPANLSDATVGSVRTTRGFMLQKET